VTCSILPEENDAQIRWFLETHADAATAALPLGWAHDRVMGYQILPGESGMDGFFYSCLQKKGA
jgi:16S rRNA (cytosine967-C5)-methyltransferase